MFRRKRDGLQRLSSREDIVVINLRHSKHECSGSNQCILVKTIAEHARTADKIVADAMSDHPTHLYLSDTPVRMLTSG